MAIEFAKGPDFSIWNGAPNWSVFGPSKAADFAIVKASEATAEDPQFRHNWNGAAGKVLRGAYHFLRPRLSWQAQAVFFCGLLGDDYGELWPTLDFEALDGLSAIASASAAQSWNGQVRKTYGLSKLLLYTNYWLAEAIAKYVDQSTWELWLAWPVDNAPATPWPTAPKGWTKQPIIWQHTWTKGGLPGVSDQTVDFNYFRGSVDDMRRFFGISQPPVPTPPTLEQRVAALEKEAKVHGWKV